MPLQNYSLTENDRFHNFKADYPARALANALNAGVITPEDAELIKTFVAERQITNSIKAKRTLKYTSMLVQTRRFIGPFKSNTIADIYLGIQAISSGNTTRGRPYSNASKSDLIQVVKTFYLWLIENNEVDIPEKKIKAIKRPKITSTKTAADLISSDDVMAMIEHCVNSRDRAILMVLYEGGFRVGEVGGMKWGDLKFDGTGVIANVKFKTDKPRYVRLVMSREYLVKWKSDYKEQIIDTNFVFTSERGGPLTRHAITRIIDRSAQRAGLEKHITPHIFRHSRITHLVQQGVNEIVIKLIMWGSLESNMLANYAHLTGNDIDREIFKLYGIEPNTTQIDADKLEPKICVHCHEINSPISNHCHICGHPLDDDAIADSDELNRWLLANGEYLIKYINSQVIATPERS